MVAANTLPHEFHTKVMFKVKKIPFEYLNIVYVLMVNIIFSFVVMIVDENKPRIHCGCIA